MEILAVVQSTEMPMMRAAAGLLSECLQAAGETNGVQLTCLEAARSDFLRPGAPVLIEEVYAQGLVPRTVKDYGEPLYQPGRKIVVLSLLADVVQTALRHRQLYSLFLPLPDWQSRWTAAQRQWVDAHFVPEPEVGLTAAAIHWSRIIAEIQRTSGASVFLCNVFRHVPGGSPYRYFRTPPSLGERIRRFNLLAADLSHDTGIYIVDLDRALADRGADALKTDYRLMGEAAASLGAETWFPPCSRPGSTIILPRRSRKRPWPPWRRERLPWTGSPLVSIRWSLSI